MEEKGEDNNFEYILNLEKLETGDENRLIIAGTCSSGDIDHDGERVDMDSLRSQFLKYMENPVIRFFHGKDSRNPDAIGKAISEYTDPDGKVWKTEFRDSGPFIVAEISNADDVKSIRMKIIEKNLRGLSIGGRAKRVKVWDSTLGKDINNVIVSRWNETSVVDLPANQNGFFEVLKAACVGDNCPLNNGEEPIEKVDDPVVMQAVEKFEEMITQNEQLQKDAEDLKETIEKLEYKVKNMMITDNPETPTDVEETIEKKEGKIPKDWWDNCMSTAKGIPGMKSPEAFCNWMYRSGKEAGFTEQRKAIGKNETTANDPEFDITKGEENENNDHISTMNKNVEVDGITGGITMEQDAENGIVRMEVPELEDFIKSTVEKIAEANETVEKLDDYDRLLKETLDMRKRIEELEGKVTAQANALKAKPQEAMKSEEDPEPVEKQEKKDDKKKDEKKYDEEGNEIIDEAEMKIKKMEAEIKALKESPLYKAQQDEVPSGDAVVAETPTILGGVIKAHYGGN